MRIYHKLKGHLDLFRSSLPKRVEGHEEVCRFVYDRSKVMSSLNRLKRTAFQPPKSHPTEISIFRTSTMNHQDVMELSKHGPDRPVLTYGLLSTQRIRDYDPSILDEEEMCEDTRNMYQNTNLDVTAQPYPHYRHGNIINIPPAITAIEKAAQKLITMKLSKCSQLANENSQESTALH